MKNNRNHYFWFLVKIGLYIARDLSADLGEYFIVMHKHLLLSTTNKWLRNINIKWNLVFIFYCRDGEQWAVKVQFSHKILFVLTNAMQEHII